MKLKGYIECHETGSKADNTIVNAGLATLANLMIGGEHPGFQIAVGYTEKPRQVASEIYNLKGLTQQVEVETGSAVTATSEARVKVPYEVDFLVANELPAINEMGLYLGEALFSRVPLKEIIKTEDVRFSGTWNIKVIEYEPDLDNYVVDEEGNQVVDQQGLVVIA